MFLGRYFIAQWSPKELLEHCAVCLLNGLKKYTWLISPCFNIFVNFCLLSWKTHLRKEKGKKKRWKWMKSFILGAVEHWLSTYVMRLTESQHQYEKHWFFFFFLNFLLPPRALWSQTDVTSSIHRESLVLWILWGSGGQKHLYFLAICHCQGLLVWPSASLSLHISSSASEKWD